MIIIACFSVVLLAIIIFAILRHDRMIKDEGLVDICQFGNEIADLYCHEEIIDYVNKFSLKNIARNKVIFSDKSRSKGVIKANDCKWYIHYQITRDIEKNVFYSKIYYRFPRNKKINFNETEASRLNNNKMRESKLQYEARVKSV